MAFYYPKIGAATAEQFFYAYPYKMNLINPGAELGTIEGWTVYDGDYKVDDTWELREGSNFYFYAGTTGYSRLGQDIKTNTYHNLCIDSELVEVEISYWCNCSGPTVDGARASVDFLNEGMEVIGQGVGEIQYIRLYESQVKERFRVPSQTRTIRVYIESIRRFGTSNDGYIDDVEVWLLKE
ncbi:hypothetical protein [Oceanobacter sp. 3_MG-2023]|uniref:hypothetical protein n=1 Tax=Oceanobacter sp. 3_MG-2023 TaxID=3062622 RepID=UPI0027376F64|nr:hypothetical protein [Oceanobacter sp. 3_MG-2023]MDP2505645.1 hypothetical protein [Oceanobacter sp. 3_MG-2023]